MTAIRWRQPPGIDRIADFNYNANAELLLFSKLYPVNQLDTSFDDIGGITG